jgi:hypothetical protein
MASLLIVAAMPLTHHPQCGQTARSMPKVYPSAISGIPSARKFAILTPVNHYGYISWSAPMILSKKPASLALFIALMAISCRDLSDAKSDDEAQKKPNGQSSEQGTGESKEKTDSGISGGEQSSEQGTGESKEKTDSEGSEQDGEVEKKSGDEQEPSPSETKTATVVGIWARCAAAIIIDFVGDGTAEATVPIRSLRYSMEFTADGRVIDTTTSFSDGDCQSEVNDTVVEEFKNAYIAMCVGAVELPQERALCDSSAKSRANAVKVSAQRKVGNYSYETVGTGTSGQLNLKFTSTDRSVAFPEFTSYLLENDTLKIAQSYEDPDQPGKIIGAGTSSENRAVDFTKHFKAFTRLPVLP